MKKCKAEAAGRFGPRYGRKVRVKVAEIEKVQRAWHSCPVCHSLSLRRESVGIWVCRHCGAKIAGGAWQPAV